MRDITALAVLLPAMLQLACGGPASPVEAEECVRSHISAILDGDPERSLESLHPDLRDETLPRLMQLQPLLAAADVRVSGSGPEGDSAFVLVTMELSDRVTTDTVRCTRRGGSWVMAESYF